MLDDSLGYPYYRLLNVIWLPFLKIKKCRVPSLRIKKFRVPSLKIQKFRVISCSCFLIDMKFISKSVCWLVMENVAFSVSHLRKIIFRIYIFKNYIQKINSPKHAGLPFENFRFFEFSILIYAKIICFQDVPINFLIFFEVFWYKKNYKYGVNGPRNDRSQVQDLVKFSKFQKSSKKYPNRSGIIN